MKKKTKNIIFTSGIILSSIFIFSTCSSKKTEITPPYTETQPQTVQENETSAEALDISEEYMMKPEENFSSERMNDIEMIVLHFSSAVTTNKENPFSPEEITNIYKDSEVSAHYLIGRDGTIYKLIPEERAAWHAGKGSFGTEKYLNSMNLYSIGIEIAAIGSEEDMSIYLTPDEYAALNKEHIGYTEAQYSSLNSLISNICEKYNIPRDKDHIIGHDEYNPLKNDPGTLFDWNKIFKQLPYEQ